MELSHPTVISTKPLEFNIDMPQKIELNILIKKKQPQQWCIQKVNSPLVWLPVLCLCLHSCSFWKCKEYLNITVITAKKHFTLRPSEKCRRGVQKYSKLIAACDNLPAILLPPIYLWWFFPWQWRKWSFLIEQRDCITSYDVTHH